MTDRRWSFAPHTPSPGELAYRRAMSYPRSAFGPSVRAYLPTGECGHRAGSEAERQALRWFWSCPDCRCSERGLPTRDIARRKLDAHRGRCAGEEPEWLMQRRAEYADALDRRRGVPAPHESRSSAVRQAYWAGHNSGAR